MIILKKSRISKIIHPPKVKMCVFIFCSVVFFLSFHRTLSLVSTTSFTHFIIIAIWVII